MLAHEGRTCRLLVLLGHRKREREWGRHAAKHRFQGIGQHHAFDVLAGLFAGGKQQLSLLRREILEARDLLNFLFRADETQPPFHHGQHAATGVGKVFEILSRYPEPRAELAPHLGDLDDVARE